MLTLDKAKLFLRIDTEEEDALIQSLINSAVEYIDTATGMTRDAQETEPLAETLQSYLVMGWYLRDNYDEQTDKVIESLTKTLKAKVMTNGTKTQDGTKDL